MPICKRLSGRETRPELKRSDRAGATPSNPIVTAICLLLLMPIVLTACDDLSKSSVTNLTKAHIAAEGKEAWCLNTQKIKSVNSNEYRGVSNGDLSMIFAEEAFLQWNDQDAYIMDLLIGGGYIAVHSGGYVTSLKDPGTPGEIYDAKDADQVDAVIGEIRKRGAMIDLTNKGAQENAWDPKYGFCLQGFWELNDVTGWTEPATDNAGKIVTHIKARKTLHPTSLGGATKNINPMSFTFTTVEIDYVAVKFNDGWRIIADE